jgi:four helix bundle protein
MAVRILGYRRRLFLCDLGGMDPHESLEAWQVAHRLALDVYDATDRWPKTERYELTAQVRRAALSVPANIAEGVARYGPREMRRFLNVARASLAEVSYLLRFARDRGILEAGEWSKLDELKKQVGRLTWGLLKSVSEL